MPETNTESMSSAERIAYIQSIRQKVVNKEEPTDDELHTAIRCLRMERKNAGARAKKGSTVAPTKQYELNDL